jgi:endoglucanase
MLKRILLCTSVVFLIALSVGATVRGVYKKSVDDTTAVSTIYPSYNTSPKAPDTTGMGNTAMKQAARIKLGWNIHRVKRIDC